MLVAGVMSGTSLDGLSIGFTEIKSVWPIFEAELKASRTYIFPKGLRLSLLRLAKGSKVDTKSFARINKEFGKFVANCLLNMQTEVQKKVELVGFHGQTVYHESKKSGSVTLQIGDPSATCYLLNVPVVSDFRSMDTAAGGQGAPLVALVDYLKYRSQDKTRVVLNIGGIANLALLPKGCKINDVVAFDTGPGNMLIDGVVYVLTHGAKKFDQDGEIASSGNVSRELLKKIFEMDDYARLPPPKTTGRERYGKRFLRKVLIEAQKLKLSPKDIVTTVTHYTFEMIDLHLKLLCNRMKIDEIIVGGGGTLNRYLFNLLKRNSAGASVKTHKEFGVDPLYWECFCFAVLAYLSYNKYQGNVPSATGAKRPVVLGRINFPVEKTIE